MGFWCWFSYILLGNHKWPTQPACDQRPQRPQGQDWRWEQEPRREGPRAQSKQVIAALALTAGQPIHLGDKLKQQRKRCDGACLDVDPVPTMASPPTKQRQNKWHSTRLHQPRTTTMATTATRPGHRERAGAAAVGQSPAVYHNPDLQERWGSWWVAVRRPWCGRHRRREAVPEVEEEADGRMTGPAVTPPLGKAAFLGGGGRARRRSKIDSRAGSQKSHFGVVGSGGGPGKGPLGLWPCA
jgi:hypothetical protein